MPPYVRPVIDARVFRDADGQVIDYGNRWGISGPPEDTYSVETNLERFSPLHTIADALITHLSQTFDVEVSHDDAFAGDLLRVPDDVVRVVRVTPKAMNAADMTFVFTAYPSVIVHAGTLLDLRHPSCGCDACDLTWESEADEMEWEVAAIADGYLRESVDSKWFGFSMSTPDNQHYGGNTRISPSLAQRVKEAELTLRALPNGWESWPRRDVETA